MNEMSDDIRSVMKPVERSFYSPILDLMNDLGFDGVQELKKGPDYVDIVFQKGKEKFIIEVKIRKKKDVTDPVIQGIVQAYRYSLNFNTKNIIVISYPQLVTRELENISDLKDRALTVNVESVILTPYWHAYETKLTVEDILNKLNSKIEQKISAARRVEVTAIIIQKSVLSIARLLNKFYKDKSKLADAAKNLTKDFGLFVTLSGTTQTPTKMRNQTIDLLSYILVTQILFYFLYAKKSQNMIKSKKVDEIGTLQSLIDLEKYFGQIRKIDYRPIYDIPVVARIPSNSEILDEVNNLIDCLTPLQVNELRHDLYGRLIGNSLPMETRKVLASYYTKTSSADLLTNLVIDDYKDKVWDLACGSGTLLVSSYNRKLKLYPKIKSTEDPKIRNQLHKQFVEHDLTGTDIMPFACHLTGLNLSARNLESDTDILRIANKNSLELESLDKPQHIPEAYGDISEELSKLHIKQEILDVYFVKKSQKEIKPKQFSVEKVDRVIINPPFTSLNKLPEIYRKTFSSSSLSKICGNRIHLWGYFLALSDRVLKEGGKLGAIIPINIFHGKDTQKIMSYYLKNYSIEYVIKPAPGKAFSEDAQFTDILFIAKKSLPASDHKIKFICLKNDIDVGGVIEMESLANDIKFELENFTENDEYLMYMEKQNNLVEKIENLMPYIFSSNGKVKKDFEEKRDSLNNDPNFVKVTASDIRDGYQLRPKGVTNSSFFTRNISKSRTTRSLFVFDKEEENQIKYMDTQKKRIFTIQKSKLVKTIRTITGIHVMDATNMHDFILLKKSNISDRAHVVIPNRFRLNTTEISFMALYFDEPICPNNSFMMFMCAKENAKIATLFFNSIFYLIQFLMFSKQSTQGFLEIKQNDLFQVSIPNFNTISEKNRTKLISLFDKYHKELFDDILTQLANKPENRTELDLTMAKCLGIKINKNELHGTYDLAYEHITKERI